jgi:hypothetical protein
MKTRMNLIDQIFGRLTVIDYDLNNHKKGTYFLCQCSCENKTIISVRGSHLKDGNVQSCGCLQKELASERFRKYNTYDLTGDYGIGYTSKGEEFYFDLEDYDKIKDYCWGIHHTGYVCSRIRETNEYIALHRLILNLEQNKIVDHINHNKIDNRKFNLRITNVHGNAINKRTQKNNTSGHSGVSYHKAQKKWCARIPINKKRIHLGYFTNKEDAIAARKTAEIKYFGEFRYQPELDVQNLNSQNTSVIA